MKHKKIEIENENFDQNELNIILLIHSGYSQDEIIKKYPATTKKIINKVIEKEIYLHRQKKISNERKKQEELQAQERILFYKSIYQ